MIPTMKMRINNENISQFIREAEFDRFIDNVLNEKLRNQYIRQFKHSSLNDIILLSKTETATFVQELGDRNLIHSALIKKKIDRFKQDIHRFNQWLHQIEMKKYNLIFETYGILTFDAFDRHIHSVADILWLIGDANLENAKTIWSSRIYQKNIYLIN
eukprot:TRINITY_DN29280_c0_g1_i1.p1 TRINITY_DN29280_c0_g1~~TRINITY_DN29280_c0_g1_i1.p1  ORF type:complete len:158 (-),score=14.30 TRINITY_DN29280_c0_g1_i1:47-520(-)